MRLLSSCLLVGTVLLAVPHVHAGEYRPYCGNGKVESGEDCEPPGVGSCGSYCIITPCPDAPDCPAPAECPPPSVCPDAPVCPPPVDCPPVPPPGPPSCGDGILQEGEDCEPPSTGSCNDMCKIPPAPECGDGVIQPGEDCEPPSVGSCNANCKIPPAPECGDGVIQPGEDCEPPNVGSCNDMCKIPPAPECGDNIVQPPEACEPPGVGNCDANCQIATPPPPPPPPPPPATPCGTCDDGKPREVTLVWACDGAPPATVNVNEQASYDAASGTIVVTGSGDKLEKDIEFSYAGGTDELHTSCSADLGPGVVTQGAGQDKKCQDSCTCTGCWRVVSLVGENGVEYCEVCPIPA